MFFQNVRALQRDLLLELIDLSLNRAERSVFVLAFFPFPTQKKIGGAIAPPFFFFPPTYSRSHFKIILYAGLPFGPVGSPDIPNRIVGLFRGDPFKSSPPGVDVLKGGRDKRKRRSVNQDHKVSAGSGFWVECFRIHLVLVYILGGRSPPGSGLGPETTPSAGTPRNAPR
jgi:hypothetical protein